MQPDLAIVFALQEIRRVIAQQDLKQLLQVLQDLMASKISGSQGCELQIAKMSTPPLGVASKKILLSFRQSFRHGRSIFVSMSRQSPPQQYRVMNLQTSDFMFTVSQTSRLNFSSSSPSILASSISQSRISLNWYLKLLSLSICFWGISPSQMQNGLKSKGFNSQIFDSSIIAVIFDSDVFCSKGNPIVIFASQFSKLPTVNFQICDQEWFQFKSIMTEKLMKPNIKTIAINFPNLRKRDGFSDLCKCDGMTSMVDKSIICSSSFFLMISILLYFYRIQIQKVIIYISISKIIEIEDFQLSFEF